MTESTPLSQRPAPSTLMAPSPAKTTPVQTSSILQLDQQSATNLHNKKYAFACSTFHARPSPSPSDDKQHSKRVKRNLASDMAVNKNHEEVEEKENDHDDRVEDSYNDNPALHRLNESLEMILTKTIEINTITNETISKYDSMHILYNNNLIY